jgi:hypothetical protein
LSRLSGLLASEIMDPSSPSNSPHASPSKGGGGADPLSVFTWDKRNQGTYLEHLVVNMASSQFSFKLMPAYGLYMMFHGQRVRGGDVALKELQSGVASLIKLTVAASRRERDVRKLALLLSNASELFQAMRADDMLMATSGQAQVRVFA